MKRLSVLFLIALAGCTKGKMIPKQSAGPTDDSVVSSMTFYTTGTEINDFTLAGHPNIDSAFFSARASIHSSKIIVREDYLNWAGVWFGNVDNIDSASDYNNTLLFRQKIIPVSSLELLSESAYGAITVETDDNHPDTT